MSNPNNQLDLDKVLHAECLHGTVVLPQNVFKCDVCGEPATNFARDYVNTTEPNDTIDTFKVLDLKCGCDKHPVESFLVVE